MTKQEDQVQKLLDEIDEEFRRNRATLKRWAKEARMEKMHRSFEETERRVEEFGEVVAKGTATEHAPSKPIPVATRPARPGAPPADRLDAVRSGSSTPAPDRRQMAIDLVAINSAVMNVQHATRSARAEATVKGALLVEVVRRLDAGEMFAGALSAAVELVTGRILANII